MKFKHQCSQCCNTKIYPVFDSGIICEKCNGTMEIINVWADPKDNLQLVSQYQNIIDC